MRRAVWSHLAVILILIVSCKRSPSPETKADQTTEKGGQSMVFTMTTTAFADSGNIPKKYTCDGEDVSPPLSWSGVPAGTKSFALICDDPDAPMGTWTHWVIWGIPGNAPGLPEGVPKVADVPGGIKQGLNSWPKVGYNGPCPPAGKPHRYIFTVFALDSDLDLSANSSKSALENAMKGHILGTAKVTGKYGRS